MVPRRFVFILVLTFICFMIPAVSFASSGVDFSNSKSEKLGSVRFATGALSSGAGWGSFTVTGNGSKGAPTGTLFIASLSGPELTLCNGTNYYTLTGTVTGLEGNADEGVTIQLTINAGKSMFDGSTSMEGDDKRFVGSVPEPSTLSMLGSGAIGLLGAVRRKLHA